MKQINVQSIIAQPASSNYNTLAININQIYQGSAQFLATGSAAGSFKLQASNDEPVQGNPINWTDITSQTISITGIGSYLIPKFDLAYNFLRGVFTSTATGVQTVSPIADTGSFQHQTITTITDTGAFASTVIHVPSTASATQADYIVISAPSGAKDAMWLDIDAAGTIPTGAAYIAAGTKTKASIVTGNTATQNGAVVAAALNTILGYNAVDNMDGTVTITETLMGSVVTPARHNANDSGNGSFSFTGTISGTASNLNSTWLNVSSVNLITKVQKNFYLWISINSEGIDPMVAGHTAIPITGVVGVSANALATSIRSALNALTNDFVASGSNAAVIITNVAFGPVTIASDGTAPTGFTFGSATLGIVSNLVNKYFLLQDAAATPHKYFVWNNVDSIGTAPVVTGYTAVPVVFASGSSAATIGTALASAIAALNSTNSFTTSGTTTVTVTNKVSGSFVAILDVNTGFTFVVTAPTGTISANIFLHGF